MGMLDIRCVDDSPVDEIIASDYIVLRESTGDKSSFYISSEVYSELILCDFKDVPNLIKALNKAVELWGKK